MLGERPFVDDMAVPGMLRRRLPVLAASAHPRAPHRHRRRPPGSPACVRVVTAADVPGERFQGLIYKDWPLFVAEGETTHCIGDILAAVVADTERHAREALAHIRVEYDELPGVFRPEEALAPGAPRVHADHDNLLSRSVIARGDVDAALAASAFVETRTFTTQLHRARVPRARVVPGGARRVGGIRGR